MAMAASPRTLAGQISRREHAEFVGRGRELITADVMFGPDAPASVLLVHGPGGIGKSFLLREIRRRGVAAGWTPFALDARDLTPLPDAVEAALEGAWEVERPLVLIDTYERMSALGGYLRATLLPSLPARAVVVVAGREMPDHGWFEGGWETVTLELALAPFSDREARTLLARHGLLEDPRAAAIARWAGGLPLALRLGAAAAREDPLWSPGADAAPLRAHLRRVADVALDGPFADAFALACVARVVTPELVADVLPGVDTAAALRWLAGCAFADSRRGGVTLHELARRPLRAELRERAPHRERELRARVADSLHARALAGELALSIDLADLVDDPAVRSGFSWDGGVDHHVTGPEPGDEELAPDAATRAFFEREPQHVLVARDPDGRPCGYSIAFTAGTDSELARSDPRLGPWLAHARGEAIVWRDSVDFTRDPRSRVQALLNMTAILGSGLRNPRYAYLPIAAGSRAARAFSAAVGAVHVPELDAGGVECHVLDYGPGGLLGAQRAFVHRELGVRPPALDADAVRDALRNLRRPGADAVRAQLEEAAERAFGTTADELLLKRVLIRGYFDPAPSHEAAAHELHLSRAAYFRRLRAASERVAQWVAVQRFTTA
jgi:hypothetical protein